jgi:serum/glucocorticoid-regulated kinase 2
MDGKIEYDYLGLANDKEIKAIIKEGKSILIVENLLFTDKIIKINRYNMSQERNILITNKAIYNLKKKSIFVITLALKRRIDTALIRGISISRITDEFVIHGNDVEYDYDYVSARRKKIIEIIAKTFQDITGGELRLCEINDKSLKNVVTLKKEKKKDATFSRMQLNGLMPINTYLFGDGTVKQSKMMRSSTLYTRRNDIREVKLEEFQTLKVLGRGSFGKVCLVEYTPTKEIYAMKSLKKDVLLDQDQVENTLLEKKILESLEHPFLVGLVFCFQTEERLYFIMPFLRGGELFQHLRKFRIFDEEK